jgi:hypothetical protein
MPGDATREEADSPVIGPNRIYAGAAQAGGCLRTLAGAEQFCAIRSYLATARKHGVHFFHALVQLAEGRPWLPETIQPLGQFAIVGRSTSLPVTA